LAQQAGHVEGGMPLERRAEPRILGAFRIATHPRVAYPLLATAALGYSVVALLLALAGANPMPEPYLRIPDADYFAAATLFYAPVIVAAWLLASGAMYLAARAMRGEPRIDELLSATAFASGLGTLGTLIADLVTSPLRAVGVIDERAWEASIAQRGGWFVFTWTTLVLYIVLFLLTYPLAVRLSTRLAWPGAIVIGVAGFLVFQGFEYVFIR
jgi:hypothetical protein